MAKPGPKTKYTPETVAKITQAIQLGAPYCHACGYAGINQSTFERWRAQYAEFAEAIKEAEGKAVVGWLARIEQAAKEGNWTAAAWKLERRIPEHFGRKDRVQVDVNQLDSEIDVELRRLALLASRGEDQTSGEAASETVN